MKTAKYILITVCGLFILIAAYVCIYVTLYLTPEVVQNSLRREIKIQLRREASFKSVEIGLLKGICLKGVSIHKSFPREKQDVLTCEEVNLQYGFVPLLLKKLLIRSVEIKKPSLNLQLDPGRDLSLYGAARLSPDAGKFLDVIVLPGSIRVKDGTIAFTKPQDELSLCLNAVELAAESISLILPFDVALSARIGEGPEPDIRCKGKISIPKNELFADIALQSMPLEKISSWFSASPLQQGQATLEARVKASGSAPVSVDGKLLLQNGFAVLRQGPLPEGRIALADMSAALTFQSEYDMAKKLFTIKKVHGNILSSPCEGSGFINFRDAVPAMNLTLNSEKFSLDDLFSRLQQSQASPAKGLKLSGPVGVGVHIAGRLDETLSPSVQLSLKDNKIIYPPCGRLQPELKGSLSISRKNISITDLQVSTKNLAITIAGDMTNYLGGDFKSNLRVVSSRINFYELLAPSESDAGEEIGPFDLKGITFSGPIKLGNTYFLTAALENVQGSYLFENNKLLISNLEGKIAEGGGFSLSAGVDIGVKGLDYSLSLKLTDAPLKMLMSLCQRADLSAYIDGTVSGTCLLKGRGTKQSSLLDSLAGEASLDLNSGHIKGFYLPSQLSSFIKSDELSRIDFNKAQLQLRLQDGAMSLVGGAFTSPRIELHPAGDIGLDSTLDLKATLKIANDLFAADTKMASYLPHEGSWVVLPVLVQGTIQRPRVSLSEEAINYILKETLPQLLMEMMSNKEAPPEGDNGTQEEEP